MSKINELIQTLCPDGVEYKKLGEVAEVCRGKRVVRRELSESDKDGYPVYQNSLTAMGYYAETNYPAYTTFIIGAGAAGEIGFSSTDFWAADDCFPIVCSSELIDKYAFYVLMNKKDFIATKVRKASIPRLAREHVEDLQIPVPPLSVQEEIVRILDEYTELEAELEAKLSEEIELKQKQYEYCASKLFEDLNVEYISMSELAKFKYGYTDKASDSGNARFIRITDIDDFGELSSEDEKYITLTDDAEKYLLTKGSLVVARTGATYGKTLYFDSDEPSVYASFLIKIDFDNNQVLNRYYWHFTKTSLYWEQANKYVKVGGQQQFNSPALGRVCVPVPSPTEQERIVKILDKYDTYTRDMISTLNTELESRKKQYAYYRDQLLTFKRKE